MPSRPRNCCYKCESRKLHCHSTCTDYQEFLKDNEELKKKMRYSDAEQHLIENNRSIGKYIANKKKRSKRIGIW